MGIETTKVEPQTEPIRLELLGTTEYDSDNLTNHTGAPPGDSPGVDER